MASLSLLHFNDVYRVTPQKISSNSDSETIDVTQFAALVDDLRDRWPQRLDGNRDGLLLFSGDVFSPSVESSISRGSHMVPVLNALGIDVSVTGNHDFDFGIPEAAIHTFPAWLKILDSWPWLLSNIIDNTTSRTPEYLKESVVLERAGIRIGFIGLVEEAWITTVASWPSEFVYQSMEETGLKLSKMLRDPNGEYRCDIIIALTHSRQDITLAKKLLALSPTAQGATSIASEHGVDLILGGHDHLYFVGRGVTLWEDFDINEKVLGAEGDEGDVLVIKSGTDFRDLSEINLELASTADGSVRNKVISKITGRRHTVLPGSKSSESLSKLLEALLSSVSSTLKAPVCETTVMLDVRGIFIRVAESPVANWFADITRHAYDDALCLKGCGGSDGVLLCAGTFRGDSTYGPGPITIGDILEILPFEDPIVVLEIDGATLWDALEGSLRTWPAQEGRFPAVSGFRVSWNSRREPGNRILGIWLLMTDAQTGEVEEEQIKRATGARKYKIVTREYMALGHDGFAALTKGKWLIDHECGAMMSSIVRKYLLGSQFINKMIRMKDDPETRFMHERTRGTIQALAEESKSNQKNATAVQYWKKAMDMALHQTHAKLHYQVNFNISGTEHMSSVDAFDGRNIRKGRSVVQASAEVLNKDLLVITPEVDGRLRDDSDGKAATA